jgi:exonuclease SbcD
VAFGKAASTEIFGDLLTGQVTVISSPKAVVIETKRGPIDVIGMPWPVSGMLRADPRFKDASRDDLNAVVIDQYGRWLDDALRLRHPDRPRVIAGHIEVRGAKLTEGSERSALMTKDPVFPVSMLARHEVDYVALGHIHMHQDLNAGSKPPVIYSGSVERISFNEEGQPKGFVIADVWRGGCEWQHIETPAREMVTIDVAIPEDELFVGHVVETAISQRPQWRLNDAIVRVRVTCTTAQRQEIKVADIRKLLNDAKVSAIAGIDIEVTDKPVRARAPEISADGGKFEIFSAYLSSVNTAQSEQDVLMAMAAELDGGRGE